MKKQKEKEEIAESGMNFYLDETIEKIKREFKFSNPKVAIALRAKASELNPRKLKGKTVNVDMKEVLNYYLEKHKSLEEELVLEEKK